MCDEDHSTLCEVAYKQGVELRGHENSETFAIGTKTSANAN